MPDSTSPAPARVRLFVLRPAGGSHLMYRHWPRLLPGDWQVCLLDAPGRGRLVDLAPLTDAGRLADFFLCRLQSRLQGPFAFFGHSMGAVVAYEMTRRPAGRGGRLPVWLGLSARGAPAGPGAGRLRPHALSDSELKAHPGQLGGTPAEVFDRPGAWARFAPLIRSDLRLVDSYSAAAGARRLPVAVSAFGGSADTSVAPQRLAAWQEHTERFMGLRMFGGGHFYQHAPGPLLTRIGQDVTAALGPAPAAVAPN